MELIIIDNKGDNTFKNLLINKINKDSKISIQTAAFSIFAFHALQKGNSTFKRNESYFN